MSDLTLILDPAPNVDSWTPATSATILQQKTAVQRTLKWGKGTCCPTPFHAMSARSHTAGAGSDGPEENKVATPRGARHIVSPVVADQVGGAAAFAVHPVLQRGFAAASSCGRPLQIAFRVEDQHRGIM